MNPKRWAASCAIAFALTCWLLAPAIAAESKAAPPFALLELFTSEGCSSCPPADRLLSTLAAESRAHGTRVIALELHVDYWNTDDWTDPFSSRDYSRRQQEYAKILGLDQIYTPQLIVNGATQFVGSDRKSADAAIRSALARTPAVALELRVTSGPDGYHVKYAKAGAPAGAVLYLALVDPREVKHVAGGENEGRTLEHTNIVRRLVAVSSSAGATGTVTIPPVPGAIGRTMRVIGFVQDRNTLAVLGAAEE